MNFGVTDVNQKEELLKQLKESIKDVSCYGF